jgi:hypothetical protein
MARLFTFGCSYTAYEFYPTWSDLLGLEFEEYENWGVTGIGNRGIAERVAECHVKNRFTPEDIVIVQWTSHVRHDYFNPEAPKRQSNIGWKTYGNMFYPGNRDVFTDNWMRDFFFEPAYVMHSLNSMIMVQELLKSSGCKWFMTTISEWSKLGSDLEFTKGKGNTAPIDIRDHSPRFIPYLERIWQEHADHWIEPIALHAARTPDLYWYFNDAQKPGQRYLEMHPSPRQYMHWLNECLRPKLGLASPPPEQLQWVEQLEKIKIDTKEIISELKLAYYKPKGNNDFWPPSRLWPLGYKGF